MSRQQSTCSQVGGGEDLNFFSGMPFHLLQKRNSLIPSGDDVNITDMGRRNSLLLPPTTPPPPESDANKNSSFQSFYHQMMRASSIGTVPPETMSSSSYTRSSQESNYNPMISSEQVSHVFEQEKFPIVPSSMEPIDFNTTNNLNSEPYSYQVTCTNAPVSFDTFDPSSVATAVSAGSSYYPHDDMNHTTTTTTTTTTSGDAGTKKRVNRRSSLLISSTAV